MEENQAAVKVKAANELFEWLELLIIALISVVVVLTFTMRMTVVDGPSMLPTLVDREYLVISNLFYQPAYNDIVILQANNLINERGEYGKPIVKRVIGLEGDVIEIDFDNGIVYRNGTALELEERDNIIFEDGHMINDYTRLKGDMNGAVTVPEGCIFVMGDNRNISKDSRSSDVGIIDNHYIVGKAYFRILPFNKIGSVY